MDVLTDWKIRQNIRKSFTEWAKLCGFEPALHQRFLIERAERVVAHEVTRLMVKVPPGSAKSTYFSVLLPPWFLCKHSNTAVLAASHSVDLAESFGRRARNYIDANGRFLGYKLASHSKAAGRWETSNGGSYLAAGVGTAIAGYRADLGIIDDPIGSREDADSKLVRDKVWDWWHFDFKTRLKPGAVIIFIYTPWHEDDLGHRILAEEGEKWTQISLPFFAEENDPLGRVKGDILWPEWFKPEMFPKDPRVATALYQLNPTPEKGNFYNSSWLVEYTAGTLPKELRVYCASDHAFSEKTSADPTLIVPFGVDANDDIWIFPDFVWDKFDTSQCVEIMLDKVEQHRPITWFVGKEHITGSIKPFLTKRMSERRCFVVVEEHVSKRDKVARAGAIAGRMAQRKVHFPAYVAEWPAIRHELLSFPVGKHDEWSDVLAEIGIGMDNMVRPSYPKAAEPDLIQSINRPWLPTFRWLKDMQKQQDLAAAPQYGDR
jgi:phage terminase large subunit-like protein